MGQVVLLQGQQGLQQGAAGDDGIVKPCKTQLGQTCAKVTLQQSLGSVKIELFGLSLVHTAA